MDSMLTCGTCGTANEAGRKFCVECGARLATGCPVCGTANPAGAKFCGECGTALGEAVAEGPGRPGNAPAGADLAAPVAERRLVSVMFTDLVGFTSLSEARDAEETRELLSRYFETAREIVERHGGVIEKFIGDAVMAVWGTPTAHEDDAERAVRTALELVAGVGAIELGGQELQARAGVLTGEAAVTIGATNQGMVAGDLVNTASRIQSAASPGTVLVGEATYRAASGAITFEEAGEETLKGKAAPVPVWRAVAVVARRGGSGRAATLEPPFVGRDEELRSLKEQFHATAREGKPRLVTIIGQAGIGKSRLGWELEKYLDGVVENIWWHEGRSPAYGEGISFWALAEMVRGRAGIAESEDPEGARTRLADTVAQFVTDPAERRWIEPRLTGLLGLDALPEESREELFAAWRTFLERMAEQGTVLLVFWDLQWADQGLLDFIEHLLTWARSSPIFVLAEARPELFERRPGWGTTVRSATSIHLEPLSDADMRRLLSGMVPGMPEQALRAIVGRAEGVPLYAVETMRMLLDRGVLRPEGAQFVLASDLPELSVPQTLHALIAARLDTLDPADRTVITDASILGLSFTIPSLAAVGGQDPDRIAGSLARLVKHELLALDADPRSPERGQYKFIQGVVREVAYQTLGKRDRRMRHLAAARYFESMGEEELAGVLASHYLSAFRATQPGPEAEALAAQARVALRAAADRATALHAPIGALGYLEQALEVTSEPSEQALLHERAAEAATYGARPDAAVEHAVAAEAIQARLGDRLGILRARTARAGAALSQHADVTAVSILQDALAEAEDLPASPEVARAQAELARSFMINGSPESVTWADRALARPELLSHLDLVELLITKGTALLNAGIVTEAEVILRGAMAVADLAGYPSAGLRARNNLQGVIEPRSLPGSLALAREMYETAQRFGQRTWVHQALGLALSGSFELGEWDDWIPEMEAELPEAQGFYRAWYESEIAHRQIYRGEVEEAETMLVAALASETVRSSAQATAALGAMLSEVRMAQGRWLEGYDETRAAWRSSDSARYAITGGIFAAAAGGDPGRLTQAADALGPLSNQLPMNLAIQQIGTCLLALLEGRWDEGRRTYLMARGTLEEAGHRMVLARLQLAVGHLAASRFREAAEAEAAAEAFFTERGAASYLATYRGAATGAMAPGTRSGQRTGAAREAERSTR